MGADVNTASMPLLSSISGLNERVENIVHFENRMVVGREIKLKRATFR